MNYRIFLSEKEQQYLDAALLRANFSDKYEINELLTNIAVSAWNDGHRSGFTDGVADSKIQEDEAKELRGF